MTPSRTTWPTSPWRWMRTRWPARSMPALNCLPPRPTSPVALTVRSSSKVASAARSPVAAGPRGGGPPSVAPSRKQTMKRVDRRAATARS